MGSHENWERETEIKIGVWQAKEKTLPDPPPQPPSPPPLHIAAGRVARPIAAPTCAEEGKREWEKEKTVEGRENAANIFGATARTRSSSRCHCHRRRCQRQRRRCYFVLVVSTVDTKSKKHFTTMSILNMATLHCTHIYLHTRTYTHITPSRRVADNASSQVWVRGREGSRTIWTTIV